MKRLESGRVRKKTRMGCRGSGTSIRISIDKQSGRLIEVAFLYIKEF
jgi:hypothetical protein